MSIPILYYFYQHYEFLYNTSILVTLLFIQFSKLYYSFKLENIYESNKITIIDI